MIKDGLLSLKFQEANHKDQAYIATEKRTIKYDSNQRDGHKALKGLTAKSES